MSETLDCTNCCIADFKHQLCDCNGDFCAKYKSIGDENDFMKAVLMGRPQEWIPCGERLPEEKEVVAVIIKQWDTGEIKKGITYRVDRNMWVGFGRHNEACVWWLPLPPWKGADDE